MASPINENFEVTKVILRSWFKSTSEARRRLSGLLLMNFFSGTRMGIYSCSKAVGFPQYSNLN